MYLVAVAELATDVEQEAPLLAQDLGLSAYEARLLLSGERPKVVLRTPDEERARALLARLRERRHGAIACDTQAIVATDAMVKLGAFGLGDVALRAGGGEELPYADLLAILRAIRPQFTTSTKTVAETKVALGRAMLTGGLVATKRTTQEITKRVEEREQLVYLVRKSGATSWVVRGKTTSFEGLGEKMAPSLAENFLRLVAELRRRAPDAIYDERLLRFHATSDASPERLDEHVHLLALAFARIGKGPYR